MPRSSGETRGLMKMAWSTAPETERLAPTSMAPITRGILMCIRTVFKVSKLCVSRPTTPGSP